MYNNYNLALKDARRDYIKQCCSSITFTCPVMGRGWPSVIKVAIYVSLELVVGEDLVADGALSFVSSLRVMGRGEG